MISEHDEIEAKMGADHVRLGDFLDFMFDQVGPRGGWELDKYEVVTGPDHYYERDGAVVRHRQDRKSGAHELTVKRRKSATSTRDREEIDLRFAKKTPPESVTAFLLATGYKHVFTLTKKAHIFWIKMSPKLHATVVIYDVWQEAPKDPAVLAPRRFIEVEAEKGSDVTPDTAKRRVRFAVEEMQRKLKLGEPLNDSLYEIFSGMRYPSV